MISIIIVLQYHIRFIRVWFLLTLRTTNPKMYPKRTKCIHTNFYVVSILKVWCDEGRTRNQACFVYVSRMMGVKDGSNWLLFSPNESNNMYGLKLKCVCSSRTKKGNITISVRNDHYHIQPILTFNTITPTKPLSKREWKCAIWSFRGLVLYHYASVLFIFYYEGGTEISAFWATCGIEISDFCSTYELKFHIFLKLFIFV